MNSLSRRRFLQLTATATGSLIFTSPRALRGAPLPAADPGISFFLIGDTHYLAAQERPEILDDISQGYTTGLIDWLNRLPGQEWPQSVGGGTMPEPAGLIHAGDLIIDAMPVIDYPGGGSALEFISTIDKLLALDFDTVLPGHGTVFRGKSRIQAFQKYLRSVIDQSMAFKKQGLSADDAAAKVNVTAFSNDFPAARVGIDAAAVRRIYQLADKPE